MSDLPYVTTADALDALDDAEILEGYRDGLGGELAPGGNRSLSYSHGWHVGRNDRLKISEPWQHALIASVREKRARVYH